MDQQSPRPQQSQGETPQKQWQQYKLRRPLVFRKRESYDTVSLGAMSNQSLLSADAGENGQELRPINLVNQQSFQSAGRSTAGSNRSRKRRREFLDLASNTESELVRFVLDTQGKLQGASGEEISKKQNKIIISNHSQSSQQNGDDDDQPVMTILERSSSTVSHRSIQRFATDKSDQFGLQKRRLVESLECLTLATTPTKPKLHKQRSSPQTKRNLIQVLNSVEFDESGSDANDEENDADRNNSTVVKVDKAGSPNSNSVKIGEFDAYSNKSLRASANNRNCGQEYNNSRCEDDMTDESGEQIIGSSENFLNILEQCLVCKEQLEQQAQDADDDASSAQKFKSIPIINKQSLKASRCTCSLSKYKTAGETTNESTRGSSSAGKQFLKLEIADEDMREQINQQYYGKSSYFLDKATKGHDSCSMMVDDSMTPQQSQQSQGIRSRSQNTPISSDLNPGHYQSSMSSPHSNCENEKSFNIDRYCNTEIELRDRVMSSKRILLRNFFTFYIKQLMMVNQKLNLSYLAKLKIEYMKLKNTDKISVRELSETIDEMEVDEQSKAHLLNVLSEQTNIRDLIMTNEQDQTNQNTSQPTDTSDNNDVDYSVGVDCMGVGSQSHTTVQQYYSLTAPHQSFKIREEHQVSTPNSNMMIMCPAVNNNNTMDDADDIYMDVVE